MQNDKQTDMDALERLNIEIGDAESNGEKERLASLIAPELAFRRADGATIDNRAVFLSKVKQSDPRETKVESIEVYGDRAVVRCIVTVKKATGDKSYHNLRLFVRHDGKWKILGWANEPI